MQIFSPTISGSTTVLGSLIQTGSLTSTDTITAQSLVITSTTQFTGSVSISGSLSATSSWASNAISSSYASGSTSASYASSSTSASYATFATSASYASSSTSASYAVSASFASTSSNGFPYKGTAIITGSLIVSGSSIKFDIPTKANGYSLVTDANGNATWQAVGTVAGFPYTGSAGITGSLNINGNIYKNEVLFISASINDINEGSGSTFDTYIKSQDLEKSKHTTINLFNFLNFY